MRQRIGRVPVGMTPGQTVVAVQVGDGGVRPPGVVRNDGETDGAISIKI